MAANHIDAARDAATSILLTAASIARRYRSDNAWVQGNALMIPSLDFGNFLRDVIAAECAVHVVADQLVEAKRDDQLVRYGDIQRRTAHHVAIGFARSVGSKIWLNLWTKDADGCPTGTMLQSWPIDGLMSEQCHVEFCERWQDIRDALGRVTLGNDHAIVELLLLESTRAKGLEAVGEVQSVESGAEMPGEAKALAMLVQNPDWSDTKIAKKIGCSRTSLYRWPKYAAARETLNRGRAAMLRGSKDAETGTVEAWDAEE